MKELKTFPAVRRGNHIFKASVMGDDSFLVVAINAFDGSTTIRHFETEEGAVFFMNIIIERDIYG